jgi:hypothetical protein
MNNLGGITLEFTCLEWNLIEVNHKTNSRFSPVDLVKSKADTKLARGV